MLAVTLQQKAVDAIGRSTFYSKYVLHFTEGYAGRSKKREEYWL